MRHGRNMFLPMLQAVTIQLLIVGAHAAININIILVVDG